MGGLNKDQKYQLVGYIIFAIAAISFLFVSALLIQEKQRTPEPVVQDPLEEPIEPGGPLAPPVVTPEPIEPSEGSPREPGLLDVSIVDENGNDIERPQLEMEPVKFAFAEQAASGVFGIAKQRIRINNDSGNPEWILSLAPSNGSSALWIGQDLSQRVAYDFNDPRNGRDADSVGGLLTIDPSKAKVQPEAGCTNQGHSLGEITAYEEGRVDSITLLESSNVSLTNCYWDITDISVTQVIPAEQPVDQYDLEMTLTILAL